MQSSAALPAQLSRIGVRCCPDVVQLNLLGDFQLHGVHDTARGTSTETGGRLGAARASVSRAAIEVNSPPESLSFRRCTRP